MKSSKRKVHGLFIYVKALHGTVTETVVLFSFVGLLILCQRSFGHRTSTHLHFFSAFLLKPIGFKLGY